MVIVGGGIALAWGERLLAPAREAVASQAFRSPGQRVRIVQATLGDDVGLIGTVPLVASALPGLLDTDDHRSVAATSAAPTTYRRDPDAGMRPGPAGPNGSDAAGTAHAPAATRQGARS